MIVTCRVVFRLVRGLAVTPVRPRRRRWAALLAILLPAGALLGVAAAAHSGAVAIVPAVRIASSNAPAVPLATAMPAYRFTIGDPIPEGVVGARTVFGDTGIVLARDLAVEKGLQVRTVLAARAVSAEFPQILNIGGVRADGMRWHPDGLALDVMIPDYRSPDGIALGDRIVAYVRANADRFALNHLIWRQVLYLPNGTVRRMADRGSDDANHFTHVHIATNGGGFPTGRETYFTSTGGGPAMSVR
jgi:hypothetical protein